jgi:branched-chain amino acid transport system substrate-binding protein
MLAAGAASDEIWRHGYRYVFGTIPAAGRQTIGLLALLAEAGIDSLALVHTSDAYALDMAAGTRKWAVEYGIRITSTQSVTGGTADLTTTARRAQQSGAKALLMAGHFDESVNMRRALKLIDWTPQAFFASVGPTLDQYGQLLRGDAEGVFATSTWEAREELKYPGSAEFLREFVRTYDEPPSFIGAQAYAAGQILERAVAKAGGIERRRLRDALAQLDTEVIIGRYAVDQSGLLIKRFPLLIQWQQGRREIVWPAEVRTAPARFVR